MRISDWSSDVCSSDLFALCGPPVLPDGGHDDIDMRLCAARDGERPGDGKSLRPCQDSSCHSPPLAVWRKPSEERYAEQRPNPCAEKGRARRVACDPRPDRKSTRLNSSH